MLSKEKIEEITKKAKQWVKDNPISKPKGTWLHHIAAILHFLVKFTALLPLDRKIKHKIIKLHISKTDHNALGIKFKTYRDLMSQNHQDQHGFIATKHCDATLFTGLVSQFTKTKVDMTQARDETGRWLRRPRDLEQCYPGHSGSSVSRDMMIGVLSWLRFVNKPKITKKTYKDIKSSSYVMGYGAASRLVLMPALEATLAEILYRQGETNHWFARRQIMSWNTKTKGYQTHLQIQHILLRGSLMGGITDSMLDVLAWAHKTQPQNPLYELAYKMYSNGDVTNVVNTLLEDTLWPTSRLPTRGDRRAEWVVQRDQGHDWVPADDHKDREYNGGDFLQMAYLILKEVGYVPKMVRR